MANRWNYCFILPRVIRLKALKLIMSWSDRVLLPLVSVLGTSIFEPLLLQFQVWPIKQIWYPYSQGLNSVWASWVPWAVLGPLGCLEQCWGSWVPHLTITILALLLNSWDTTGFFFLAKPCWFADCKQPRHERPCSFVLQLHDAILQASMERQVGLVCCVDISVKNKYHQTFMFLASERFKYIYFNQFN
jgi:hypothetical protein